MASGWRRRRPGWEWWCDDHPGAGRRVWPYPLERWLGAYLRVPVALSEWRARQELRAHLQIMHADEFGGE